MPISLIVEVNDMRLGEQVLGIFDKVFNGGQVREGFHAKLAVESATESVEDLILLLSTMPYYDSVSTRMRLITWIARLTVPLVHITNSRIERLLSITPRAAGVIEGTWRMLSHNFWEQLFVDITRREICLEPALWVLVLVVVGQTL
jgi:hypothetical protein